MSTTGLAAHMLRQKALGSIYASHPVPQGNYVINEMNAGLQGIHMGALSLGSAIAGEGNEGMGLLGLGLMIGLGYFAVTEIMSGPEMKPARRNPRRRRNGTKKGMRRKTARRAYMKSAKQKRAQSKAKKAMKLYHSGKAPSLKAAWKMV